MIPGIARPLRLRADDSVKDIAGRLFAHRRRSRRSSQEGAQEQHQEQHQEQQPSLRDFLRRHPAIVSLPPVQLPLRLDRAAVLALKQVPESPASLAQQAETLCKRWMLEAPLRDRYTYKREALRRLHRRDAQALEDMADAGASEDAQALEAARLKIERLKMVPLIRQYATAESRLTFHQRNCILYMVGRLAPNYAAGVRALYELRKRWPEFRPRTQLDFGSGLGTAAWAANTVWPGLLREHFLVDPCAHMNSLAALLMQDGSPRRPACFPGVYLRQFLPASEDRRYDLVTCAHSLLALEDADLRHATVDSLWAKVEPGGALVIVEYGSRAGFAAVAEARGFLLDNHGLADAATGEVSPVDGAHIVAPCPHAFACPRLAKRCSFPSRYVQFRLSSVTPPEVHVDQFAYLIVSKGSPGDRALPAWPRIVEPRGGSFDRQQLLVGLCLPDGSAGYFGFSPGNSDADLLLCARAARLGDRLPALVDPDGGDTQPELLPEPATRLTGNREGYGEGEGDDDGEGEGDSENSTDLSKEDRH